MREVPWMQQEITEGRRIPTLQDLISTFQVIAAVLVFTAAVIRHLSRLVRWLTPKTARVYRFTVELGGIRIAVVITIGSRQPEAGQLPGAEGDDGGPRAIHDR